MMREAGLAYTISFPDDGERATEEFRAKNPAGKIPVLVCPDGGQVYESLAIVQYLARHCPHLVPETGSEAEKIYLSVLTMLGTTMYPAYHRQHHTYQYGPEQAYPEIQAMARSVNDSLYDYIETLLDPYICGAQLTAADLYLYMISRWNVDKTELRASRPKLAHFIDTIRAHPTIEATLASQPRRK
jgi:glutathione S-transferase